MGAQSEDGSATGVNPGALAEADDSAGFTGAACVFVRVGTTWTQQAYVKAFNTDAGDFFGASVSVSGDTLVVGAGGESSSGAGVNPGALAEADDSAGGAGATYVFVRAGTTWTQQAYLKASNTDAGDQFGRSVAISGDSIVVGANAEDSVGTGVNPGALVESDDSALTAGAAYVFVRGGTTWTQQAYVKASNTDASDQFGVSVAISADTLVVGAINERSSGTGVNAGAAAEADDSAVDAGAAYVFVRSGTTWTQQAYVKASNTDASDLFGTSVAISGDSLVVGATGEDGNGTRVNPGVLADGDDSTGAAGAAYVFVRSGATWVQLAYLKASNSDPSDQFGQSAATSSGTVVVGANLESGNGTGVNPGAVAEADDSAGLAGAAYVIR